MRKMAAVLVLLAVLAVPIFAQQMTATQEHLQARVKSAECRLQFQIAVMNSIQQRVPSAADGLQTASGQLSSHMSQMRMLANSGNATQFSAFMKDSVIPGAQNANAQMTQARNRYGNQNAWQNARGELASDYGNANGSFQRCADEADMELGEAKLNMYQHEYEYWQNVSANLSRKGADTSEIDALLAQARNSIQTKLQGAMDSGNPAQVRTALRQYCLADGCPDGENGHVFARLQIARAEAVANKLKPEADAAGLGNRVQNALGNCTQAKSRLGSIGTRQFSGGEEDEVWGAIRNAHSELSEALRQLRAGQ